MPGRPTCRALLERRIRVGWTPATASTTQPSTERLALSAAVGGSLFRARPRQMHATALECDFNHGHANLMNAAVAKYKYFFVSGVHKSGTSWLAHLLRAHPAVAMPRHELWLFGHKQSIAGAGLDRLFENWLRLHCVAREAE